MKATASRLAIAMVAAVVLTSVSVAASPPKSKSAHKVASPKKHAYSPAMQAKIKQMRARLARYEKDEAVVKKNLKTFDTLDYVVFTNQEWTRLHESHSKDVIVNWPDGHHTNGIQRHISDLKALFVYAPDTRIKVHPVRFGVYRGATGSAMTDGKTVKRHSIDSGEGFTCVEGIMQGTFTKPMPIGDGKFIEPTGKEFSVPMCTVGRWKNGVMVEEWLYWDNATYMRQIGLGK